MGGERRERAAAGEVKGWAVHAGPASGRQRVPLCRRPMSVGGGAGDAEGRTDARAQGCGERLARG
jgi:hypothetical protein